MFQSGAFQYDAYNIVPLKQPAGMSDISRTPVTLAVMTLDYCGRTFGSSPCLAAGTPCYNTFPTCKYKSAYLKQSKDYKFTSADAPIPFQTGERPYIKSVKYLPTEIKDNLTIAARVTAEFYDEPDTDVGIDPYLSQRASVQGAFWKKLLARNRNYKGRTVKIYEGFLGDAEGDFAQKWVGVCDNITLGKGVVKIEIVDLLKSLANIEVPPKLDIKLLVAATAGDTQLTLSTVAGLDAPGYVRIADEIIYYTTKDAVSNIISGCTRGFFGTAAAAQSLNAKAQKVRYYAPANPFDILSTMLTTDAGIAAGYIDSAAFTYWRDWPGGEVNFSAIISEPTKLDKLYFEIIDLLDCKSWVAEDLKITIRRNLPNEPGRAYTALTDSQNIIHDSASADLNEKSRITRAALYWDRTAIGKPDEVKDYNRLDIAIDADAEGANEYGDVIEKKIFCRWLRSGYMQEEPLAQFVKNFTMRQVWRQRDALPIITLDVELKDSGIKTGDYLRISTDEILTKEGAQLDRAIFQAAKREFKGHKTTIRALQTHTRRLCFVAPDAAADFAAATEAEKEYGYICADTGQMADETGGYFIY